MITSKYEKENEMQIRILSAAAVVAAGLLSAQTASAMPINGTLSHAKPAGVEQVRWHGGGWHGGWRGRGWGYGLGGFAAGALIGSALAQPYGYYPPPATYYYPPPPAAYAGPGDDAVAYCMQRFRSYDPNSGTYLGYDGARHPCP
jgi:hypothetical protein